MIRKKSGAVFLVGAGPGDPELVTLRGLKLIESADVILYDALVSPRLLEYAKDNVEKIFVGKAHGESSRQSAINDLMVQKARAGKMLVRLKGGDPMVFGRGGEEIEFLIAKKIAVEVVPGITAAFGAFASLVIPVTHRKYASQLALMTGHADPAKKLSGLDYENLARFDGTLIFYMASSRLAQICRELIRRGKKPDTPCVVVRWATTPLEESISGTLKNIFGKVRPRGLESPSLIIVGDVVRHRLTTDKFKTRPLFGKKILITRSAKQSLRLRDKLERLGAEVISLPAIRFSAPVWGPVDEAIGGLENKDFDWVVFTSQNGVDFFSDRLSAKSKDWRILAGAKIAVIGSATAERLAEKGIRPDLIPPKFVAESLFAALKKHNIKGKRFLLLRGDLARPYLREVLKKAGAIVKEVVVYRTFPEKAPSAAVLRNIKACGVDFIPFTSSSSVENFVKSTGSSWLDGKTKIVSIGPVTSRTLKNYGLKVYREAKQFTIDGLIDAICK
ncbi:MAG: uroporphyrinogen-III C-methyltransferase [Candidatus Omnitrophica bacterium]|nr:uroporphyrinogen-III C-methyltransferase [Candidatus Omnitrophota bacterium]